MATSFGEFQEDCLYDGITLHPRWLARPSETTSSVYAPGEWLGAVAGAAELLRQYPSTELTDQHIPAYLIDTDCGLAQTTLIHMINASLLRDRDDGPGRSFNSRKVYGVNTCATAEGYFAATIEAMDKPNERTHEYGGNAVGWSIIESDGQAIALSKTFNNRSTLSLVPISVNSIPYPAGSLFQAYTPHTESMADDERLALPVKEVVGIAFLRLSALALPPDERQGAFPLAIDSAVEAPDTMRNITLEQVRDVAQRALHFSAFW